MMGGSCSVSMSLCGEEEKEAAAEGGLFLEGAGAFTGFDRGGMFGGVVDNNEDVTAGKQALKATTQEGFCFRSGQVIEAFFEDDERGSGVALPMRHVPTREGTVLEAGAPGLLGS